MFQHSLEARPRGGEWKSVYYLSPRPGPVASSSFETKLQLLPPRTRTTFWVMHYLLFTFTAWKIKNSNCRKLVRIGNLVFPREDRAKCNAVSEIQSQGIWLSPSDFLHLGTSFFRPVLYTHTHYMHTNRHVILPKELCKKMPQRRLMTEDEWRSLGVTQSQGWCHYMLHTPEPHILLFRRPITDHEAARRANNKCRWSLSSWTFLFDCQFVC